jgi:hypothetical protein
MNTINLNKGEFYTIEAFTFVVEDNTLYIEDRDEDLDTYWYDDPIFEGQELLEYVTSLCHDQLQTSPRIVDVSARRYATIVDGFPTDYGDSTIDSNLYVWTGKRLLSESDYLELVTN